MKVLDKVKLTKKFACFRKPPPRRAKDNPDRIVTAKDPLEQVHREIAILKKLNHPNVVKLVEVLNDPSDTFLYMGEPKARVRLHSLQCSNMCNEAQ